jgi:hypothetical protein
MTPGKQPIVTANNIRMGDYLGGNNRVYLLVANKIFRPSTAIDLD